MGAISSYRKLVTLEGKEELVFPRDELSDSIPSIIPENVYTQASLNTTQTQQAALTCGHTLQAHITIIMHTRL